MEIPEVDAVHAEPFEGLGQRLRDIFRVATDQTFVGHDAELGSQEDLIALSRLLQPGHLC